jgi:biopolymer transport protein ExbB/biopolymer transport protein TolQ
LRRKEAAMDWNLVSMLHSMSLTAKGVVVILLLMSAISIGLAAERGLRYAVARKQSRAFVQQVTPVLEEGKLDKAISIAVRNKKSPIARMVATGLSEFQAAPPRASSTESIDAAERGLERSVATIHAELKRGLSGLATIGSTAPFVGLFGTVVGIMNAFRASAPAKAAGIQSVASGISEALVTTALGLLVAVPAVWCYNYFSAKVENFDVEMENSSMELVSYLVRRAPRETSLP